MTPHAALLACLALAACYTPQQGLTPYQRCMAGPSAEYRALWRAAREAEANLARGYRLVQVEVPTMRSTICRDGAGRRDCLAPDHRPARIPLPIDRDQEQARLANLDAKLDALRPAALTAVEARCGPLP